MRSSSKIEFHCVAILILRRYRWLCLEINKPWMSDDLRLSFGILRLGAMRALMEETIC